MQTLLEGKKHRVSYQAGSKGCFFGQNTPSPTLFTPSTFSLVKQHSPPGRGTHLFIFPKSPLQFPSPAKHL